MTPQEKQEKKKNNPNKALNEALAQQRKQFEDTINSQKQAIKSYQETIDSQNKKIEELEQYLKEREYVITEMTKNALRVEFQSKDSQPVETTEVTVEESLTNQNQNNEQQDSNNNH